MSQAGPRPVQRRIVERRDEKRWVERHGLDHVDNWCTANGLPAGDVESGSVVVTEWADGSATIEATILERDDDGNSFTVGEDDDRMVPTLRVQRPLLRPLPDDIGRVESLP